MPQIYQDQEKYDLALEYFNKSLSIQETLLFKDHPHIGTTYANIGVMYCNRFLSKQAIVYYEKAKDILSKSHPPNHPDILQLEELIRLCQDRIQWEEHHQQQQEK